MDKFYAVAMQTQLAELEEELQEIATIIQQQGYANTIVYRAAERNLQLLIEACIGIAKQTLKGMNKQVPEEARRVFEKLKAVGQDHSEIPWHKVIGMRNALVHDYLNLDRARIIEVITEGYYKELFAFAREKVHIF